MNYFKLQISNGNTKENHVDEVIADNRITTGNEHGKGFVELVKPKDIVMVHKGNMPYCLVQVIQKITKSISIKGVSFGNDYRVNVLSYYKDIQANRAVFPENYKTGPNGTFTHLKENSNTLAIVKKWFQHITNYNSVKEIKDILQHKKQIILQGPPGTGKTRLAKQIANEFIKTKESIDPINKIDAFFKGELIAKHSIALSEAHSLLNNFSNNFPKEKLKDITISDYSIGNGQNNSFCWWIERGLKPLGYYSPGNATSYLIYWSKEKEVYSIHGKNLKDLDENEAIKLLSNKLNQLVNNKDYNGNIGMFGESFMLKILHSYYPNEYFPINSDNCMNNVLGLINVSTKGLTRLEKNLKIQAYFLQKTQEHNSKATSYEFMNFLFENFDLKGEIELKDSQIVLEGKSRLIQFHPSYTYEDFVRGISVKNNEIGQIEYKTENKVLARIAKEACENNSKNYILIIDEINRANLSSVLGELIYALEYRGEPVESMYEMENSGNTITLPPNLYIIGTMNTADRSVGQIDYAIRRRFAFVDVLPKILDNSELEKDGKKFAKTSFEKVTELFIENNNIDKPSIHLSEEFKPKDVWLGHSYFILEKEGDFSINLEYEIKPILREYIADGILKESARNVINGLSATND